MTRSGPILAALAIALWSAAAAATDFNVGMAAAREGDFAKAFASWKPLADAGHARAQVNLAEMYATGNGVEPDLTEAARLYRAAAEGGYHIGQLRFAMALQLGEGVPRDKAAALDWLRKAAEQHLPQAVYELGYAYYEGEGVAVDRVEAMKWFVVADEYGWKEAYPAGLHTADQLTEAEMRTAVERAGAWMAEHPRPPRQ